MDTDALIRTLAADITRPSWPLSRTWWAALAAATGLAALVFFTAVGPRADFAEAIATLRFPFKFVVTSVLAVSAFGLLRAISRPEAEARTLWASLLAAPVLVLAAVVIELLVVPQNDWAARLIGTNNIHCLVLIPLIGAGPLGLFLLALRHGAPPRPGRAGAVAGLLAGGLAATFYAAHCFDDSPLFVATWYTIPIAGLTAIGALLGGRIARW
ncbi:MAG TPA: NrsF family protein [Mesorhizobium sp.]|jgi:hypothetical protein|nr:NrsF family protein [Mesorhizobium sp.]